MLITDSCTLQAMAFISYFFKRNSAAYQKTKIRVSFDKTNSPLFMSLLVNVKENGMLVSI